MSFSVNIELTTTGSITTADACVSILYEETQTLKWSATFAFIIIAAINFLYIFVGGSFFKIDTYKYLKLFQ